uniref:FBD domain-containing protein n=1 Tax=Oryza glaberrima TaxID=4538 RepID=I1QH07_ORYGL
HDFQVDENPLERITWKFRNLRTSNLSVDFGKISSIMSIFSLLRCAPQIEQLNIEVDLKEAQGDDEIHEGILEAYMSEDLVKTLKRVTLSFIKCFPGEMSFIKLLLSKAASLESLKVMMFWHHIMPVFGCVSSFHDIQKGVVYPGEVYSGAWHGHIRHRLLIWESKYFPE